MKKYLEAVKPAIRAIEPYSLQRREYSIKLNQNENPYDLPEWLKQDIFTEFARRPWNRYPGYTNSRLEEELARYLQVSAEHLTVGNGSNELLQLITTAVLSPGRRVLLVSPTFPIYKHLAHVAEAEVIDIEFAPDWSFPVEKIVATLKETQVELCILCSPNSPTGATLPESGLAEILEAASGLVVVDEAYREFSEVDYRPLQNAHPNLIFVRTFSKAIGLAGLRVGYLIAHPDLNRELTKAKLPYNVNVFSELVAEKLLAHPDWIEVNIQKILQEKGRLFDALQTFERLRVFPSAANFFMIETAGEAPQLFEQLVDRGILIRDISGYHPRLANKLRITVGTPAENDTLIETLKEVMQKS